MANKINIGGTTQGDAIQLDNVILEVYSQEILFQAEPALRFMSVVTKRTELETMPGRTIRFLRYGSLDGDAEIEETQEIETDVITSSVIEITVTEHAKAISQTEFLIRSALTNTMGDAAIQLGSHYARTVDSNIRDVLQTSPNVIYCNDHDSRADLTGDDVLNVDSIRACAEFLATNKAPMFDADGYICFVHPHQGRYLRKDPAFVSVTLATSPEDIRVGEIGRIEDVRFIQTTQVPYILKGTQQIWADQKYSGVDTLLPANPNTNVYRSSVVGDYSVGFAEALPVEMRDDGVHDFGRKRKLAWYSIYGIALIETGHALILETA